MSHWRMCTHTPKLLVPRAEKYITQKLVRAASHHKRSQFCLRAQGVLMNMEIQTSRKMDAPKSKILLSQSPMNDLEAH